MYRASFDYPHTLTALHTFRTTRSDAGVAGPGNLYVHGTVVLTGIYVCVRSLSLWLWQVDAFERLTPTMSSSLGLEAYPASGHTCA